jgi:rubrerythrin
MGISIEGGEKMSYSFEEMSDEQLAIVDDLEMLREDLIGELQAINQYEDHVLNLENEGAVSTLEHIIEEEKEHVAELLRLIQNLDPVQAEKLKRIL